MPLTIHYINVNQSPRIRWPHPGPLRRRGRKSFSFGEGFRM